MTGESVHWLFCQKYILVATSLGSKMPKRKRGTKAEPLCSACGKHGHYASLCVLLAKAVLSQITKTTSVATLQKLLQNETPLNLQEGGKKQRCGKTKGRRGKRVTASQKKTKRTYVADRCVAERKRTPRPRKGPLMDSLVSMKPTLSALRHLRTTGWAWKPRCGCGSKVSRCSWKTCCSRGRGRIFSDVYLARSGTMRWSGLISPALGYLWLCCGKRFNCGISLGTLPRSHRWPIIWESLVQLEAVSMLSSAASATLKRS